MCTKKIRERRKIKMKRFINKVQDICKKNEKVAMFIDMDGTINEYEVYLEKKYHNKWKIII